MVKIKDLDVTVTYRVGLGDIEVPENVFKELEKIVESGIETDGFEESKYPNAISWLTSNIKEKDCCDWKLTIDELR